MSERELTIYGCTAADLVLMLAATDDSPLRVAFSLLSDAQELMHLGDNDQAQVVINRAKWILLDQDGQEADER